MPQTSRSAPLLVGICGAQGSGKSTTARQCVDALDHLGIKAATVSIDDFYLQFDEQQALNRLGNPFLQGRGLPGTHDVALMLTTLQRVKNGVDAKLPIYDKSQHNGLGDRVGYANLKGNSIRVLFLEGWCVGFRSQGRAYLKQRLLELANEGKLFMKRWKNVPLENYLEIDNCLSAYDRIWDLLDLTIVARPEQFEYAYDWRKQQEHDLIASTGSGMSDDDIVSFVDKFLPCCYLYTDKVRGPVIVLDRHRNVVRMIRTPEAVANSSKL